MIFEGIGKYFLFLFLFYLLIVLIVKISLSSIFKRAGINAWKAFIPIYNKYLLIQKLDLNKKVFFMTFIPFVNLYFYNIIIGKMLEAFEQDSKESLLFLVLPMYKFPEFVLKNPVFKLHLYDSTEEFIHNEKSLFDDEKMNSVNDQIIINPSVYDQTGENTENIFSNESLVQDERKETFVEAKNDVKQEDVNPVTINNLRPKVCPRCGTKLESTAKVCFFCGSDV